MRIKDFLTALILRLRRALDTAPAIAAPKLACASSFDQLESRTLFSAPAAPTSLKITPSGTSLHLKWTDNSTRESGFTIYRGTSKTSLNKLNTVAKNDTTYDTVIPKTNTTYYYAVKAFNSDGSSGAA